MHQSKAVELWVGVFVALGFIALFFLAMQVSNLGDLKVDEKSFRITARFTNAGSLKPRAAVSMAGVRVGRVESIRFDKESYEAVVEMRIDAEYDTLPDDTSASILTAGLLGEQYVGLSPGASDEYLKDGAEIELTQSAIVLEQVIGKFLFSKAESGSSEKAAPEATSVPPTAPTQPPTSDANGQPVPPIQPTDDADIDGGTAEPAAIPAVGQ